jgi:hypothetical protein
LRRDGRVQLGHGELGLGRGGCSCHLSSFYVGECLQSGWRVELGSKTFS